MVGVKLIAALDLSVPVGPGTTVYPGDPEPHLRVHATIARDGYNLLGVSMGSQTGTHVDAPFHLEESGARIDAMDLRLFAGPAVVVDATGLAPRERITVDRLDPVRARLEPGAVVLLRTDWSRRLGSPRHLASPRHHDATGYFAHPFLDPAACALLLDAGIRTIGIDAPSLDETPDAEHPGDGYPCHHLVARAGGVIAENLTALAGVESLVDPVVCLFPIRLAGADGAPVRAVALQWG